MADFQQATFATGCFWCTEAMFSRLTGVTQVVAGYTGGTTPKPTYEQVSTGNTGHAEAAQITFDPAVISFDNLLVLFWHSHDPTTLNRQGGDIGTQYRSAIFYHDVAQREVAERSKAAVQQEFPDPIVTEIVPLTVFYPAEDYHQNYYANHPNAPYCAFAIKPKLVKVFGKV